MILETSWGTADRLDHRPRRAADRAVAPRRTSRSTTHRRTPTDYDAEHVLLRTVRCVNGEVQTVMDCEPVLRLRPRARRAGTTPATATTRATATAEGDDVALTLTTDMRLGFEGGQASARTLLKEGDIRFVALSWGEHRAAARPTTTPTRGWSGPRTTGSTGWPAASSPTTRGAATCSAAR